MNPKIKNILIAVAIFAVLITAYLVFFNKKTVAPLATTTGAPVPASVSTESQVGQEFLQILLNIRNIKLDDSVLTSPAFNSLQDYTITLIPEGNEGRPNPFAPIGVDSLSEDSTTVSDLQPIGNSLPAAAGAGAGL